MSKSISAGLLSELLKLYPKQTAEKTEKDLAAALQKGEKPSKPPKNIAARYADSENGRMFYANEKGCDQNVIFYIHGGAYTIDINV